MVSSGRCFCLFCLSLLASWHATDIQYINTIATLGIAACSHLKDVIYCCFVKAACVCWYHAYAQGVIYQLKQCQKLQEKRWSIKDGQRLYLSGANCFITPLGSLWFALCFCLLFIFAFTHCLVMFRNQKLLG